MEKSLDEDKLILPDNGNYGGDWRSVGLRGVRSLSKVNMCEKSPVSTIWDCVIDPAATTLAVDISIYFSICNKLVLYYHQSSWCIRLVLFLCISAYCSWNGLLLGTVLFMTPSVWHQPPPIELLSTLPVT